MGYLNPQHKAKIVKKKDEKMNIVIKTVTCTLNIYTPESDLRDKSKTKESPLF